MSSQHLNQPSHEDWMRKALSLATKAMLEDEVPIGAIVVYKGKIVGQGYNQCNSLNDSTAHAEIACYHRSIKHYWRLEAY